MSQKLKSKRKVQIEDQTKFLTFFDGQDLNNEHLTAIKEINSRIGPEARDGKEFMYNLISITYKLINDDQLDAENVAKLSSYVDYYNQNSSLFSRDNIFLSEGYKMMDNEYELYSSGETGVRGIMTCPRCKKDNISIYSKQKSRGDEGETLFNTCLDCGNRWLS